MIEKTLNNLLAVQTVSHNEQAMVDWLVGYAAKHLDVLVKVDCHRNVYMVKGGGRTPTPCVAAHLDTVQPIRDGVHILEDRGRLIGVDKKNKQVGIGADDKAGIFVCLNMLERFDNIRAVFFAGEEVGCYGAKRSDAEFFNDVGYLIEYDCPSRNMLSYSSGGVRLFENDGAFIKTAVPVLTQYGTNLWQHHPYSDVMALRQRFPISCLNLSCGYYNWHQSNEFISLSDMDLAISEGEALIKVLGENNYPCPVSLVHETASPIIPVTRLSVPDPS